jgi:AraC-like DNA-binding protein
MSQRLLEMLQEDVIPALATGAGILLPCAEREVAPEQHERFQPTYTTAEFQHTHYELFWLRSGRSHMKIDGKIYRLEAGDCCFLPPQSWHCDMYNEETPAYESLWVVAHNRQVGINHFYYQPVGTWDVVSYSKIAEPPELPGLLTALQHELHGNVPFSSAIRQGLILQLAGCITRALETLNSSTVELVSQRVLTYLEAHYAEEISLQAVAQAAYLSPNYLTTIFKKETGHTITEALTEIRLRHARRLLMEKQLPVYEVARAVGYENDVTERQDKSKKNAACRL